MGVAEHRAKHRRNGIGHNNDGDVPQHHVNVAERMITKQALEKARVGALGWAVMQMSCAKEISCSPIQMVAISAECHAGSQFGNISRQTGSLVEDADDVENYA